MSIYLSELFNGFTQPARSALVEEAGDTRYCPYCCENYPAHGRWHYLPNGGRMACTRGWF